MDARRWPCRRPGFSLAEIVVALAILMIVIPAAFPIYESFVRDSQDAALRARLLDVRRGIRIFYEDNGRFPYMQFDHFGNAVNFLEDRLSELTQGVRAGRNGQFPARRRRYIDHIPEDPLTGRVEWNIVTAPTRPRSPVSRRPMTTTTSTRQLRSARRGVTSDTIQLLDNIKEVEGLLQVMDIRSRQPGYEDF